MPDESAGLSWAAPEFALDPYGVVRGLGGAGLAHDSTYRGWVALRHRDVVDILRGPDFVKDPAKAVEGPYTRRQREMAGSSIMFMDDPDRRRVRGLVTRAFTRARVEAMRARIGSVAHGLLDRVAGAPSFDLVTAYSTPLSVTVIAVLLGVAEADRDRFKRWSDDIQLEYGSSLTDAERERITRSRNDLVLYFVEEIEARTREPRDDLITALVQAHDERGQLSLEELVSTLVTVLVTGNVTTTDLISNGVFALLTHPEQLDLLRRDRSLLPNAVEEILRYDSPITVVDRIATEEREIAGCPVRQGEWVWPALTAANHDPDVHPAPERFDITRTGIRHVSFGAGPRLCLGAALARIETQVALGTLLDRFPGLSLDPDAPARRHTMPSFRGFAELTVRPGEVPR